MHYRAITAEDGVIEHLEALAGVLRELSDEHIELFEYCYHRGAFGGFEVVLGKGHHRAKFGWDGKESILSVSTATVQNMNSLPSWIHDAYISLPGGEGLYAEIWSESVGLLSD